MGLESQRRATAGSCQLAVAERDGRAEFNLPRDQPGFSCSMPRKLRCTGYLVDDFVAIVDRALSERLWRFKGQIPASISLAPPRSVDSHSRADHL